MIQPTRRLVPGPGRGLPAGPAAVAPVASALWIVWAAGVFAVVAAATADLALAVRPRRLRLAAQIPDTLFIGERDAAQLAALGTARARATAVEVLCDLDERAGAASRSRRALPSGAAAALSVPLVPRRRSYARVRAALAALDRAARACCASGRAAAAWAGGSRSSPTCGACARPPCAS